MLQSVYKFDPCILSSLRITQIGKGNTTNDFALIEFARTFVSTRLLSGMSPVRIWPDRKVRSSVVERLNIHIDFAQLESPVLCGIHVKSGFYYDSRMTSGG